MTGTIIPPPMSPATARMRRYRERKQDGRRCVKLEILESEIDALVRRGLLGLETRNDPIDIAGALYKLFEDTLT